MSRTARRAVVLAMTVPVATAVAVSQGAAFASDTAAATTHRTLDAADQQIAKNLDARVQDPRLAGSTLSGLVKHTFDGLAATVNGCWA